MKEHTKKTDSPAGSGPKSGVSGETPKAACSRDNRAGICEDHELARRCLDGEVTAWEEIYAQCHDSLLVSIEIMLGPGGVDRNLIDELAARVWYGLVADDGKLLAKFDPKRGARLITFMRAVARDVISRHFRSEKALRDRELAAVQEKPKHQAPEHTHPFTQMGEFLDTLTQRERAYCTEHLLAAPAADGGESQYTFTSASARMLSFRIRKKLTKFLGSNT